MNENEIHLSNLQWTRKSKYEMVRRHMLFDSIFEAKKKNNKKNVTFGSGGLPYYEISSEFFLIQISINEIK